MKKKNTKKNNRLNLRAKKNNAPKNYHPVNVTAISLKAFLYLKLNSLQTQFNHER